MLKYNWLVGLVIITIIFTSFVILSNRSRGIVAVANNNNSQGFAVVELFTSEGCSSCPPADKIVETIQKEYADQPVYVLAYHVDYWDRLGWEDPFDDAAYSARQYKYTEWLKLESAYTPQIVVNGKTEFVGSNEAKLRSVIKSSLEHSGPVDLSIKSSSLNAGKLTIDFTIKNNSTTNSLLLAVIQKSATSKVLRGENKGKSLSHVQIVRQLQTVNIKNKNEGHANFTLSTELSKDDMEIIAFLQDGKTGAISGAAKTIIP